jgi:hypothetical protein
MYKRVQKEYKIKSTIELGVFFLSNKQAKYVLGIKIQTIWKIDAWK